MSATATNGEKAHGKHVVSKCGTYFFLNSCTEKSLLIE